MDDFALLSIGRQFVEMAIRNEQILQALRKEQNKGTPEVVPPKE